MLGNYYNVVRFMVDEEVDYDYGFMVDVHVREDFDNWSEEEKARAPHFMVDSTERNFGTLREGEEAKMVFKIPEYGGTQFNYPENRNHMWLYCGASRPAEFFYPVRRWI